MATQLFHVSGWFIEKFVNERKVVKAHLVARCFEKDSNNLRRLPNL